MRQRRGAPTSVPAMPMSPAQSAPAAAAPAGTIATTMGDMWVRRASAAAKAGKVTFAVTNSGQMKQWLGIIRAPAAMSSGLLNAAAVLAKSADLAPGQAGTLAVTLTPGTYELVCLEPRHYSAGQHETFSVTR